MSENTYESSPAALSLHTNVSKIPLHKDKFIVSLLTRATELNLTQFLFGFPAFHTFPFISRFTVAWNVFMPTHHWQVRPGRVCWRCLPQCNAANWWHPHDSNCPGCPGESAWRRCKLPVSAATLDLWVLTEEIKQFFLVEFSQIF